MTRTSTGTAPDIDTAMVLAAGFETTDDYNGPQQEGVAYYQRTIRNGRRWSAAHAFLRPAMRRANLTVVTGAVVTRPPHAAAPRLRSNGV